MDWRKGVYALFGGILGFLIVLFAYFWVIRIAIQSMSFFGGSSLTGDQSLIIYCFAPLLIIAGSTLTAKSLGASWQRSVAAGVAALASVLIVLYATPQYSNYFSFGVRETLTLVCSAAATVLVSILGKPGTNSTELTLVIGLSALLMFYSFVFKGYESYVGFAAWTLIPFSAGLFRKSNEAAV